MEEEINDTDVKLLYDAMSNHWRIEKDNLEMKKIKQSNIYKFKSFISWYLDIKAITFYIQKPNETI